MSLADDLLEAAAGTIIEYAGISLPAGYLWANGQSASRATYSRLFAAITISITGTTVSGSSGISSVSQDLTQLPTSLVGSPVSGAGIPAGATIAAITSSTITLSANATASGSGVAILVAPHGVGDGSTTFGLPDRRGRAGVGHDKMGAASAAGRLTPAGGGVNGALLGHAAGVETHTLTSAQMPTHTHANTLSENPHSHTVGALSASGGSGTASGGGYSGVVNTSGSATTGITISNASQGGGGAHPNVQPSIVMNYIIKT